MASANGMALGPANAQIRDTLTLFARHVAPLMEQLGGSGLFDRQSAEHEWARGKPQVLVRLLAFQTDACNGLRAPKFLFGDNQVAGKAAENRPGRLKTVVLVRSRVGRERL